MRILDRLLRKHQSLASTSPGSELPSDQPIPTTMVKKMQEFFGALPAEKQHRLKNIISIYTGAQNLQEKLYQQSIELPLTATVQVKLPIILELADESWPPRQVNAQLKLTLKKARTASFDLLLAEKDTDEVTLGSLVIYPVQNPGNLFIVSVHSDLYPGNGLGTGMGILVDTLGQVMADFLATSAITIEVTDHAFAYDPKDPHHKRNIRQGWTTNLADLGTGWELDQRQALMVQYNPGTMKHLQYSKQFFPHQH